MIERANTIGSIVDRLAGSRRVRRALLAIGIVGAAAVLTVVVADPHSGWDAHAYWAAPVDDPYAVSAGGASDAFLYAPAFRQAIAPIAALPWPAFHLAWEALLLGALFALTGPLVAVVLAIPLVLFELWAGNIHLLLAAAVVVGFRYPPAWSFVLLTKVTPGVALLWFAVRREWRQLAIALGATAAIAAVSFVLAPPLWQQWIDVLSANARAPEAVQTSLWLPPLWMRLVLAVVLVVAGAQTNRRWTVIVAATVALPYLAMINLTMLVGLIPLLAPAARERLAGAERPARLRPATARTAPE